MRGIWKHNITVCLMALLFAMTGNSYAGNVEVKLPTNSAFQVISGVQPVMHVGSNGKVGIGTTTPSEKLQIKSISPRLRVDSGTTGVGGDSADDARIVLKGNAPGYEGRFDLIATTAGDFRIAGFNGTETHIGDFITINQSGNVGVGTTSPSAKLEVYGSNNAANLIINSPAIGGIGDYSDIEFRQSGSVQGKIGIVSEGNWPFGLRFFTAAGQNTPTEKVRIMSNGNVGIGTTTPTAKLEVDGAIKFGPDLIFNNSNTDIFGPDTGTQYFDFMAGDEYTNFVNDAHVRVWGDRIGGHENRFVDIYHDGSTGFIETGGSASGNSANLILQNNGGNVGIGTTSPSYKLHVNGTAAGTSWTNLSSRDFKEDINVVGESEHPMMLAKLMDMDLSRYRYKKEYGGEGDAKLGFIAEEMPKEVLSKDGKGVDVYELLTFTIGAMKAQQKEIETQRQYNKALEDRLAALEKLLEGK